MFKPPLLLFTLHLLSLLLIATSFFPSNVLADPIAHSGKRDDDSGGGDDDDDHRRDNRQGCLSRRQGDEILTNWINFFVNPIDADVAARYLTPDFRSFSESVNSITPGKGDNPEKVAAPTATDIPSFIASQSFNDGSTRFTIIAKSYACDSITFRWQIATLSPFPVGGIDLLLLGRDRGSFKIKIAYSEFNTVAFLVDIGQFPTPCVNNTV